MRHQPSDAGVAVKEGMDPREAMMDRANSLDPAHLTQRRVP
jgi:hypothetical protein